MEFTGGLKLFLLLQSPASECSLAARLQALGHTVLIHHGSGDSALLPIHRFQPHLLIFESLHRSQLERERFSIESEFPHLPCAAWSSHAPTPPKEWLGMAFIHDSFCDLALESTLRFAVQTKAELKSLRDGHQDLERLLDGLGHAVIVLSSQRVIEWLNEPAAQLLALPGSVALGRHVDEIVRLHDTHQRSLTTTTIQQFAPPYLLNTHRGQSVLVSLESIPLSHPFGYPSKEAIVLNPVDWQVTPTEGPTCAQPLPRPQIEHWVTHPDGALVEYSPTLERLVPVLLSRAQMKPVQLAQFVAEEDQLALENHLAETAKLGFGSTHLQTAEGSQAALLLHSLKLGDHLIHWLGASELEGLEDSEREKLNKLDSLGLLARGFAHDFNNLLTVLSGNLALGQQKLHSLGYPQQEWENAQAATQEAQSLVQQLLTFASGGTPIKKPLPLHDFLREFVAKHPRKSHVDYFLNLSQGEIQVEFDPQQIRRVLSNLFKNSEQALGAKHGMITLSCRVKNTDGTEPGHGTPMEVEIQVRDTGEGMEAEQLSQVFQPYYSTRQAMNATGLGLTVCESIVKAHGGHIKVVSYLGEETAVTFTLPANLSKPATSGTSSVLFTSPKTPDSFEAPPVLASSEPAVRVPKTSPRILLLDDEKGIRNVVRMTLAPKGYDLTETEDGLDTLRAYQKALLEQHPFDLVILDLSIPMGMGGLQTMESLKDMDPRVKAIVSSGYSDDPVMSNPKSYGFTDVLPKPYLPKDLLNMVKKHLG